MRGKLSRRAIRALEWWAQRPQRAPSRKIWREPTTVVWATDASKRGHGGLDHAVSLEGFPVGEEMGDATLGLWTEEESHMTICALELRAFRIKLEECGSAVAAKGLLLLEDNMGEPCWICDAQTNNLAHGLGVTESLRTGRPGGCAGWL